MEDFDVLKHAQTYIEKMAAGVDPLTGNAVPPDDLIANARIARCLAYVNDKLKALIAAGGVIGREHKPPFVYDPGKISAVVYVDKGISLTEVLHNVAKAYDNRCAISYRLVAPLLVQEGVLMKEAEGSDKLVAAPTAKAKGIWSEPATDKDGRTYMRTLYDANGQRYVVSLLKAFDKQE